MIVRAFEGWPLPHEMRYNVNELNERKKEKRKKKRKKPTNTWNMDYTRTHLERTTRPQLYCPNIAIMGIFFLVGYNAESFSPYKAIVCQVN